MTMTGREADGTLWVSQDEICGHILLIPANEEEVYEWDYERGRRFATEDEAMTWHDANCPNPGKREAR